MRRVLLSIVSILGIAACRDTSSIVSAHTVDGRELSEQQVATLNGWLQTHQAGWGHNFATPPPPSTVVIARQRSGRVSSIEFFDKTGWAGVVVYQDRVATLSPADVAALQQQLDLGR
jgi:hypothetical protein